MYWVCRAEAGSVGRMRAYLVTLTLSAALSTACGGPAAPEIGRAHV